MKKKRFANDFSVGFVLFVATVIVIASLFTVGDGKNIFTDHVEYVVRLPSAGGLRVGSKVELGGVIAGSVKRIEFPDDLASSDVLVTIILEKAYRERIREDSWASIATQGLLGDSMVAIKIGTAEKPILPPGSSIRYK
jgi:phospholipid/cholesterol/gamma-HCH transport system substrate-binding protein